MLCGVVLLRTVESGHPKRRPMRPQDFVDHALPSTGSDHMDADLGILKHPFPLLLATHPGAGLIAADQPTAAQARQDFRHPIIQPAVNRLEQIGQAPFADAQAKHLGEEPGQAFVTDCMRVPQVRRQTLDRRPNGVPGSLPVGTGATYSCPQPAHRPPYGSTRVTRGLIGGSSTLS